MLQRDPAGVYGGMDFRSRDRYRHAVEELAEPTGDDQLRVALEERRTRAPDRRAARPTTRSAHVGYHLIGSGRRAFEESVAWSAAPARADPPPVLPHATPLYLGAIVARHRRCWSPAPLCPTPYTHGWRGAALALVALLTLVPASELTIQILQRIISELIPPRPAAAARSRRACPRRRGRW